MALFHKVLIGGEPELINFDHIVRAYINGKNQTVLMWMDDSELTINDSFEDLMIDLQELQAHSGIPSRMYQEDYYPIDEVKFNK